MPRADAEAGPHRRQALAWRTLRHLGVWNPTQVPVAPDTHPAAPLASEAGAGQPQAGGLRVKKS